MPRPPKRKVAPVNIIDDGTLPEDTPEDEATDTNEDEITSAVKNEDDSSDESSDSGDESSDETEEEKPKAKGKKEKVAAKPKPKAKVGKASDSKAVTTAPAKTVVDAKGDRVFVLVLESIAFLNSDVVFNNAKKITSFSSKTPLAAAKQAFNVISEQLSDIPFECTFSIKDGEKKPLQYIGEQSKSEKNDKFVKTVKTFRGEAVEKTPAKAVAKTPAKQTKPAAKAVIAKTPAKAVVAKAAVTKTTVKVDAKTTKPAAKTVVAPAKTPAKAVVAKKAAASKTVVESEDTSQVKPRGRGRPAGTKNTKANNTNSKTETQVLDTDASKTEVIDQTPVENTPPPVINKKVVPAKAGGRGAKK